MNAIGLRLLAASTGTMLFVAAGSASAQYYQRGHVDHHDHVVRDSHGHVVGRTHHDVYHPGGTQVVPTAQYPAHDPHHHHPSPPLPYDPHAVHRPAAPQFGTYSHVDDLATRLETLTNDLLLDLHFNYAHNPGFQETYREAYAIFETAKYVHKAEHSQDRAAIAARLGGLDAEFHHIQGDVRGWSRHHHRQIGQLGILTKMDRIEEAIHHLMTDVGVQSNSVAGAAPYPTGQAPPPAGGIQPSPAFGAAPSAVPVPNAPPAPPAPHSGAAPDPASLLNAPPSPPPTIVNTPPPAN